MRKATMIVIAGMTLMMGGIAAAQAGPASGIARPSAPAQSLIDKVACWRGQRDYCPYHMKRGRGGACVPCRHGVY